jgi:hypothetical protein
MFEVGAGNWFGGKKRAAHREAANEIAQRNMEDQGKIKEVFENEKFDGMTRKWKGQGFTLVTTPTVAAPEIFDPAVVSKEAEASWKIDFSLNGIDAEGKFEMKWIMFLCSLFVGVLYCGCFWRLLLFSSSK